MKLLIVTALCIISYAGAVFIVEHCSKCTTKEAKAKVNAWLKTVFGGTNESVETEYNASNDAVLGDEVLNAVSRYNLLDKDLTPIACLTRNGLPCIQCYFITDNSFDAAKSKTLGQTLAATVANYLRRLGYASLTRCEIRRMGDNEHCAFIYYATTDKNKNGLREYIKGQMQMKIADTLSGLKPPVNARLERAMDSVPDNFGTDDAADVKKNIR